MLSLSVSLVDGYDLPMRISNNVGCPVAECAVDLDPDCPAPLRGPVDSNGYVLGCRSACVRRLFYIVSSLVCLTPIFHCSKPTWTETNRIPVTAALDLTTCQRLALPAAFSTTTTSRASAPTATSMLMTRAPAPLSGLATLPRTPTIPSLSALLLSKQGKWLHG